MKEGATPCYTLEQLGYRPALNSNNDELLKLVVLEGDEHKFDLIIGQLIQDHERNPRKDSALIKNLTPQTMPPPIFLAVHLNRDTFFSKLCLVIRKYCDDSTVGGFTVTNREKLNILQIAIYNNNANLVKKIIQHAADIAKLIYIFKTQHSRIMLDAVNSKNEEIVSAVIAGAKLMDLIEQLHVLGDSYFFVYNSAHNALKGAILTKNMHIVSAICNYLIALGTNHPGRELLVENFLKNTFEDINLNLIQENLPEIDTKHPLMLGLKFYQKPKLQQFGDNPFVPTSSEQRFLQEYSRQNTAVIFSNTSPPGLELKEPPLESLGLESNRKAKPKGTTTPK
jgi:hypothetical protein